MQFCLERKRKREKERWGVSEVVQYNDYNTMSDLQLFNPFNCIFHFAAVIY